MKRIPAIDIARGLVMIIMALDHARDYLHVQAAQSPTDLATTTPVLFFTRWITHLCAPSFVFLAGTSAWLYLHGGGDRRFLLRRGFVLIMLEFTVVNFALFFDIHFRLFMFEVIATIGAGMILLSFLCRLSPGIIVGIALLLILGHDIIDFVPMPASKLLGFFGSLLLGPDAFKLPGGRLFVVAYPILPWLGIMLAGFAAGRTFEWPADKRKRFFIRLGFGALAAFILLRACRWYGDPFPWSAQKTGIYTFLSFMNVTKYPPSLLFTLVTVGLLLLVLVMAEKVAEKASKSARILLVYGKTPFFYFIIHLYLIHALLLVIVLLQGYRIAQLDFSPLEFGRPQGAGVSLGSVYLVWITVVIALYPLCRWYGDYKSRHRDKQWLRYL